MMASSHLKRWVTALIAVPALLAVIYCGSATVFSLLITAVILLGVHEYNGLVFGEGHGWEKAEGLLAALLIALVFHMESLQLVMAVILALVFIVFSVYVARITQPVFDIAPVFKVVFGFMYISATLSHFMLIRHTDRGVEWIFFILVLAFSGDVAAYYVGKTWGKRKLLPLVSPGKTVEGTIGLFAGSVVGCVAFQQLYFNALPIGHAILIGFFGSVIGQLGDLCESSIKRSSGFKDSGSLLPGHGGILDRLDCLIFIAPFVYYYRLLMI